jgi:hypothetical protein
MRSTMMYSLIEPYGCYAAINAAFSEMPLHKLIHYSRVFIAYEREKSEIIAFSPIDILIIDA